VNIQRQPGANIIAVVDRVKDLLPQLRSSLPSSVQLSILTDRTETIRASVSDVQFELMLTVALVVMVIFLFLRTVSATAIPSIAVPLSIVGTFGVMYLLGYSLNNLSLMALTISTGFVVDDAIVMIENIMRYIEEGDPPLEAALKGSQQIGFTILSLTVSLIAVLIPLLFMGDIVGRLFREFAITLSVTILVSAVVSLTLTRMMCAKLLSHRPEAERGRFYAASERAFKSLIDFYGRTLNWVFGLWSSDGNALGGRRNAGGDRALHFYPQGIFSGAGHRRYPGCFRGAAKCFLYRHGGAAAGSGARDLTRASLSSFIGIDGSNTTLNSGRIQINLKPVLGVLYESYIHPVTILSTLPSAGVSALLALILCRRDFNVIALIAIVKKNGIMMIDFALDAERNEGKTPREAIYQACLLRRPILMTTLAALLGGVPLALGTGMGAEFRRPLGNSMIGGFDLQPVTDSLHYAGHLLGF
jgi:multidrug efflux pump